MFLLSHALCKSNLEVHLNMVVKFGIKDYVETIIY